MIGNYLRVCVCVCVLCVFFIRIGEFIVDNFGFSLVVWINQLGQFQRAEHNHIMIYARPRLLDLPFIVVEQVY